MENGFDVQKIVNDGSALAVYQQTKKGNERCGDQYFIWEDKHYLMLAIADGLGSGNGACAASTAAIEVLRENHGQSAFDLIQRCNTAMYGTRGIVLGIARLDYGNLQFEFCGIGNVQFVLFPSHRKAIRTLSMPGFLAGRKIKIRSEVFSYEKGTPFAMFSDGIIMNPRWEQRIRHMTEPAADLCEILRTIPAADDDMTLIIGRTENGTK